MVLVAGLALVAPPASAAGLAQGDAPSGGDAAAGIQPELAEAFDADDSVEFWVRFEARADLSQARRLSDWAARGEAVAAALRETAAASQAGVVEVLSESGLDYREFWATNAIYVYDGSRELAEQLAVYSEVEGLYAPVGYQLIEPAPAEEQRQTQAVAWGIENVRAPEVWDQFAVRGEDITVAHIDTGVQFDHPALVDQYRGNLGDGEFDHNYNWFDATGTACPDAPCDPDGHGSHTMGTMVGDDGGNNQIGMAPGANWISANGCLTCSDENLVASGEWMLAPTDLDGENPRPDLRPHVINNSWGSQLPSTDPFMEDVLESWEAAGIFGMWSNGNSGPFCASSGSPGSRTIAYSAGAYDINNNISFFSSRGPGQDGEIKPNIAAPGVNIRSALPGDDYGNLAGTSMAAPHVAGAVALIWSAAPGLLGDIEGTIALLDGSAIDVDNTACGGDAEDNNVWGEGRLDAFAAVDQATRGPTGTLTGTVTDDVTDVPLADATVTVTIDDRPRSALTGSDGVYTFDAVPVGTRRVRAEATGYRESPTQPVKIVEDETATGDFTLAPLPELAGTVTDAGSGEPIAGAVVESTTVGIRQETDADGAYRMRLRAGRHTVTVTASGYAPHTGGATVTAGAITDHSPALTRLPVAPVWESSFAGPGLDDNVLATTVWDDGRGPALYAGGLFRTAGGSVVSRVARWDGHEWAPLSGPAGTGVDAQVHAMAVYGGDLIVGGSFIEAGGVTVNRIARWDGTKWYPLGTGMSTGQVRALTVFDGDLIAAGNFTSADGVRADRVARWDGEQWSPLSTGVDSGTVLSLAVFGDDLIAGGNFLNVGGTRMNRVARWDGSNWSPLAEGLLGAFGSGVNALTVHSGALIAAGSFTRTGDAVAVNRIARWDGSEWSALAGPAGTGMTGAVHALTVLDGTLIAGGAFTQAGGVTANRIARWNGGRWSPLAEPPAPGVDGDSVRALTVFGDDLIAAGPFSRAGGTPVNRIARWDGGQWSPLAGPASQPATGLNGPVQALTVYDGDVIAGGRFTQAGGQVVNHIARWDGSQWTPLGSPSGASGGIGVDDYVWALTVYDGDLIVGGQFTHAGDGVVVNNAARWDGSEWSPLTGSSGTGTNRPVRAMTVVGGTLIAGGQFTEAGGLPASRVARWDGSEWSPLGTGVSGGFAIPVQDLIVFDGSLIVAGQFADAGEQTVNNIARWDGTDWSPLTGSSGTGVNQRVQALSVYDGELIAGGGFTEAGGVPANWIARWDGSEWSPFASQLSGGCCSPWVRSLTVFDDSLVAGGVFTEAGGEAVNSIARWDGGEWSPLGGPAGTGVRGGLSDIFFGNPGTSVEDLATVDVDGPGLLPETLVAGGSFSLTGGVPNWGLAAYRAPIGVAATSYTFRGDVYVDLRWAGSTSDEVDIYRNGELLVTRDDDGEYTDELGKPGTGTVFRYWVCEAGTEVCSEAAVVETDPRDSHPPDS